MFSPKAITDSIISRIRKSNNIKDLKKLQVSGYLTTDEFYLMKDLVMHGSIKYTGFEYFERGSFPYLENSLNDLGKVKQSQKIFFLKKTLKLHIALPV